MCPVTAEIRNYGRLNEMIIFCKYVAGVKFSFMIKTEYPQFPPNTRPLQSPPSDLCSVDRVPAQCGLSRRGFVLIELKITADVLSLHELSLLVHLSQKSVCHCCLHVRGDWLERWLWRQLRKSLEGRQRPFLEQNDVKCQRTKDLDAIERQTRKMCNCMAGILGSKSSKTDLGSGDSYAESLWDIISLSVCSGGKRRRNSRCHFVEGSPCPHYSRWQIITQRERTISRLNAGPCLLHGLVSERRWRRRSGPSFVVWVLYPPEHHKKKAYLLYRGSECTGELMTLWGSLQQC